MNRESSATIFEHLVGALDMRTAVAALEAVADLALYIAPDGAIEDVHWNNCSISPIELKEWIGRPWKETVTVECRDKIEELVAESTSNGITGWREINQVLPNQRQLPMRYCVIGLGGDGRLVAIGRDLAAVSALQQQVIQAQQNAEHELARARRAEKRYQLLFQSVEEAVFVVEAWSLKVLEVNEAAEKWLGWENKRLVGRIFQDFFPAGSRDTLKSALERVRVSGKTVESQLALDDEASAPTHMTAHLYRHSRDSQILIRVSSPATQQSEPTPSDPVRQVYNAIHGHPDAFVLTDQNRNIIKANDAFLDLIQVAVDLQVEGQSIDRWLGRPGVDVPLIINSLENDPSLRNLSTVVFGELGQIEDVQVSVARIDGEGGPLYGFLIREIDYASAPQQSESGLFPHSAEQMSDLVGRVPLKDLIRETTDIIEKLCIDAALQLTNDNRASAAEMLGLSRQSLYSKMRRFGIGERSSDEDIGAED